LSTSTLSRPRRIIGVAACTVGALAFAPVAVTLVLLAIHGHPGGVLAAVGGAAVPVVLWGAWRIILLVRTSTAQWRHLPPSEGHSLIARGPGTQVHLHERSPNVAIELGDTAAAAGSGIKESSRAPTPADVAAARESAAQLRQQLETMAGLRLQVPLLDDQVASLASVTRRLVLILGGPVSAADAKLARALVGEALSTLEALGEETTDQNLAREETIQQHSKIYMRKERYREALRRATEYAQLASTLIRMIYVGSTRDDSDAQ
jgi:hypothetical protein